MKRLVSKKSQSPVKLQVSQDKKFHSELPESSLKDLFCQKLQLRLAMGPLLFKKQILIENLSIDGLRLQLQETPAAPSPTEQKAPLEVFHFNQGHQHYRQGIGGSQG